MYVLSFMIRIRRCRYTRFRNCKTFACKLSCSWRWSSNFRTSFGTPKLSFIPKTPCPSKNALFTDLSISSNEAKWRLVPLPTAVGNIPEPKGTNLFVALLFILSLSVPSSMSMTFSAAESLFLSGDTMVVIADTLTVAPNAAAVSVIPCHRLANWSSVYVDGSSTNVTLPKLKKPIPNGRRTATRGAIMLTSVFVPSVGLIYFPVLGILFLLKIDWFSISSTSMASFVPAETVVEFDFGNRSEFGGSITLTKLGA